LIELTNSFENHLTDSSFIFFKKFGSEGIKKLSSISFPFFLNKTNLGIALIFKTLQIGSLKFNVVKKLFKSFLASLSQSVLFSNSSRLILNIPTLLGHDAFNFSSLILSFLHGIHQVAQKSTK
jgi:hypothetical protein